MFTFEETPASRQETSEPPTYTLVFKAAGEQDNNIVYNYALAATSSIVYRASGALFRKDLRVDPDGWGQYVVTVPYERLQGKNPNVGDVTFSFDTTGATINVKCAKSHIATYTEAGLAAGDFHKGAINVRDDGDVEGVDIIIPALKMTYTLKHPAGIVNEGHARILGSVTGMMNAYPFRGFQAMELLFAGATGSDGTNSDAELAYHLIASGNATGLTIGGIAGIAKAGHDYLWVEFKDAIEAGRDLRQPEKIHIERVYEQFDMATVFGWS